MTQRNLTKSKDLLNAKQKSGNMYGIISDEKRRTCSFTVKSPHIREKSHETYQNAQSGYIRKVAT